MNKSNRIRIFIYLGFILIIGFIISKSIKKENDISENYSFTFGKIYKKTKNLTDRNCSSNYYYEFYFNGIKYSGEDCGHDYFIVNDKLYCKVEFSTADPNQNKMYFLDLFLQKTINNGNKIDTIYEPLSENKEIADKIINLH
ncbi:hypothetical protein ACGK9U_15180 [Mariniflexile sp. HNIBRBA6329]|uniref:hypothetical protein n=1 Tax=Mariniflexile sp. HNIBRBA6329 TaxID=3373088 RepID=UPI00374740D0